MAGQKRYGFVIEVDRCIDCEACMVACEVENQVPLGHHRNWVRAASLEGTFPNLAQDYVPGNCMHCENPPCVQVCPTGASYQRPDGLVLIDQTKCIGCQFCIEACPYGARYYDESRGVVDKCSACVHRLAVGQPPACVETCVGGARHFGDLNDPESDVAKLVAAGNAKPFHPETGTVPQVYYVSARGKTDAEFPVNAPVSEWVALRRNLERPAALGLLAAAVAVTGGAFRLAHRNAVRHFEQVAEESAHENAPEPGENQGAGDAE
jgi:tetrathionate reductase subunit B